MLPFRTRLRAYLGTDLLPPLEKHVTTMIELLNGLVAKTTEASAAQQASFLNLHNAVNRLGTQVADLTRQLNDAVANNGLVTEEMQTLANGITESLNDMKKAADTADDGFEPVEEPDENTEVPDGTVVATPPVADSDPVAQNTVEKS